MNGRQQIQYIAHTISPTILNSIITYIPSPVFPPLSFSPYPFNQGCDHPGRGGIMDIHEQSRIFGLAEISGW